MKKRKILLARNHKEFKEIMKKARAGDMVVFDQRKIRGGETKCQMNKKIKKKR